MAQMRFNSGPSRPNASGSRPGTVARTVLRYQPAVAAPTQTTRANAAAAGRYAGQAQAYANRAQTAAAGRYQAAANAAKNQPWDISQYNAANAGRPTQANAPANAAGPRYTDPNDPRNNPAYWRQNNAAVQAGRRYAGAQGSDQAAYNKLFGVDYYLNGVRSDYVPDPTLFMGNMGEWAGMAMSYDEAQRRKQARDFTDPDYAAWYKDMANAANTMSQADFNAYRAGKPRPVTPFDQLQQEFILRQNAQPEGYQYVSYGPTYIPKKPLEDQAPGQDYGGGGYGGYGDGGWDGGGGYDYTPPKSVDQFWQNMVNWRIRTPQGG